MTDLSSTKEAYVEDADFTIIANLLSNLIKSLLFDSNNTLCIRFDDPFCPKLIKLDITDSTVIIKQKNAVALKKSEEKRCD